MGKDDAVKLASDRAHEYKVHGYDRQDDGYGGPYHPDAFQDPAVEFALAGDPEAQAEYTKDLYKLDQAKAKNGAVDQVDLVAASAHSTVVESLPHRVIGQDKLVVPGDYDNVDEASNRKVPERSRDQARKATPKTVAKKAASNEPKRESDSNAQDSSPAKSTPKRRPVKKAAKKAPAKKA